MSEQYGCPDCNYVEYIDKIPIQCPKCGHTSMEHLRWTKGGDGSRWEGCENVHWDCRIAQLEAELARRDEKIAELTATKHSQAFRNAELSRFVWWVYCVYARNVHELTSGITEACTYETEEKAEKGKYGLPIRCWEYIRYLEEYTAGIYNGTYLDSETSTGVKDPPAGYSDAVSAGKVSVDVKIERDLSDAEIEELGAQEAERKEFCPNCEAETPCTHEAELYVCDICGEDFAKYIVSRSANVSDVSVTRDVSIDIKTPSSTENTNPDYYKQELARRDEYISKLEAKIPKLNIDLAEASTHAYNGESARMKLEAELARRDEELKITDGLLKEATETIGAVVACCTYNSNDDAKIGIYGIDQKAFTMIDQFITHYSDAVSAGKVSVDVKTSTDNNSGAY